MKLLIVSRETQQDKAFGLGKSINAVAKELTKRGHDVAYITVAEWRENDQKAYNRLLRIGSFAAKIFKFNEHVIPALSERFVQGMKAFKIATDEHYSTVWFQDPWIAIGFLYKKIFSFSHSKISWGVSEHGLGSFTQAVILDGFLLDEKWTRLLLNVEKRILKKSAFVLTPSKAAKRALARDMGYPSPPLHWHDIGYGKPKLNLTDKGDARIRLGWDPSTVYVICVGRIAPVKRYDIVINACAFAQKKIPHLQLVIIGGELDPSLVKTAKDAGLTNPPIGIFTSSVDLYLSAADIYVSACEFESFGLANLEAVCAGLPCIIAAGGGSVEVVSSGGWLCHPDFVSIGKALIEIADNKQTEVYWKKAALEHACQFKEWKELIDEYETYLLSH